VNKLNLFEIAMAVAEDSDRVVMDQEWVEVPGQPGVLAAGSAIQAQYMNPVQHPLSAPTVSTTTYTVDMALNAPTRVTRTLMDLTLQRFFADRVFANTGGVTGGAVVYDELIANDLYLDRDIERVAPVTSSRWSPARGARRRSPRSRSGAASSSPSRLGIATTCPCSRGTSASSRTPSSARSTCGPSKSWRRRCRPRRRAR
jgi:hypothetical protein